MVRFHIGSHKTATTRLQEVCQINRDALAASGRDYYRTREIARLLGKEFRWAGRGKLSPNDAAEVITPKIAPHLEKSNQLVFSFENAIGGVEHLLSGERPAYIQTSRRLETLAQVFQGVAVEVFLSIRSFAPFFNSAYSELTRLGYGIASEEARNRILDLEFSWIEFVERVQSAWPEANLTIWNHADYRTNEIDILNVFTGVEAGFPWFMPNSNPRASISKNAALALVGLGEYMREKDFHEREQIAAMLTHAFPIAPNCPTVDLWTATETEEMNTTFNRELAALRARSDVRVLSFH